MKLVFVGDGATGKTSLLICYTTGSTSPTDYIPTVLDTSSARVTALGKSLEVHLWETPGREDSDRLRSLSYPNTDAVVICFSVVSWTSIQNVKAKWVPEVQKNCDPKRTAIVLIGTKTDLRTDEKILSDLKTRKQEPATEEQGQELLRDIGGLLYVETSALTDPSSVQTAFQRMIDAVAGFVPPKPEKEKKGRCVLM